MRGSKLLSNEGSVRDNVRQEVEDEEESVGDGA